MSEALDQLRAEGFAIGPGKLHRFSCFGIRSTRDGRAYRISPQSLADLRYILHIERALQLGRDHDGLCLELAYRSYHTIPWNRVHRGAHDRVAGMFAKIDRELHRSNNWNGLGFHPRRIPHLARQLARHYIPKRKVASDPAYGLARNLLEQGLEMLLAVAYNETSFSERNMRRLLITAGALEPAALQLSSQLTPLLDLTCPTIRVGRTSVFQAILQTEPDGDEIQAAVQTMRLLPRLSDRMKAAGMPLSVPAAPDYPLLEPNGTPPARVGASLHALAYAGALFLNSDRERYLNLQTYLAGERPEYDSAIDAMGAAIAKIPKVIGIRNATQ
ncbi:MAG: hypothetical protein WAL67_17575 [Candidatus Cybelea sp.]